MKILVIVLFYFAAPAYADTFRFAQQPPAGALVTTSPPNIHTCGEAIRTELRSTVNSLTTINTAATNMILRFSDRASLLSSDFLGGEPRFGFFRSPKLTLVIELQRHDTKSPTIDISMIKHQGSKTCYETWHGELERL
jgi:hypothetical protein